MEPWLDSLSEDWNSEPRSSSPTGSVNIQKISSLNQSQSRIPHLVQNLQNNSRQPSYIKPRSSKGIARSRTASILAERSASNLNIQSSSPRVGSQKSQRLPILPRRTSSAFSDSQNSVQHHTIEKKTDNGETLEWKRRLVQPDDTLGDGLDLFSPSKLEGMFKQSSGPIEPESEEPRTGSDSRPWSSIRMGSFPLPSEQYSSYRTSVSRKPAMEVLQEENEEEIPDFSAVSSDLVREGSMHGLVKRRVSNLEQGSVRKYSMNDSRIRTISGQQEMDNEAISPITASKQNTIREQAMINSLDLDTDALRKKLLERKSLGIERPSSRSSDHDISYDGLGHEFNDDNLAEMTSQSLPEDLSMGTQDYGPTRVSKNRANSREQSLMASQTIHPSLPAIQNQFRSSPPPYRQAEPSIHEESISEEYDASVLHHDLISPQTPSSGSPLKLFGNRDTYTNNKLMRVLTQFEQHDVINGQIESAMIINAGEGNELRMSQFGQGELDGFDFKQEIERYTTKEKIQAQEINKIFTTDPQHLSPQAPFNPLDETVNQTVALITNQVITSGSQGGDRSPKRRRTLLQDEAMIQHSEVQHILETMADTSLAGKKRKDAKAGKKVEQASPETLAARPILRPKSGSRKSSIDEQQAPESAPSSQRLKEALAAELQSFAEGMNVTDNSSRKPSLATKDYMAEANKVMEFIRARGKPKVSLPDIEEPEDASELQADAILDLEVDESTKDSFSRPPSREGPVKPRTDRRHAQHNPSVASHLRKFRDSEDLDLLTSTSVLGTLHLVDNQAATEAAEIPIPEENEVPQQQSSPPGMRILKQDDAARKRKHSNLSFDARNPDQDSIDNSMKQTFVSNSSSSSGLKGMIASGTVNIPDRVGAMTFDHDKQKWVKQQLRKQYDQQVHRRSLQRQSASETDPFEDIPDLSIDEQREAALQVTSRSSASMAKHNADENHDDLNEEEYEGDASKPAMQSHKDHDQDERPTSQNSRISKHEERLYEGLPSKDPRDTKSPPRQARVVTISFSSPVASEIPYHQPPSVSDADIDEDDPSLLPIDDDSPTPSSPADKTPGKLDKSNSMNARGGFVGDPARHEQYRAMTLNRRPVSRIDEYDEEQFDNVHNLSLIHIDRPTMTPEPSRSLPLMAYAGKKESSMLCLTPLSDFTLHQIDKLNHPEESYVEERPNPKTLRHAHGSHAQVEDALVKAITDAAPEELFWEQLKRISLKEGRLATLHGLKEYCRSLEVLDVSNNQITQLIDMPPPLRTLNISSNLLNDLTSWQHLQNLQYVDVSSNELESLEAFHGLIHLRTLNASNNRIRSIEGILDLDGLVSLNLSKNELVEVNFSSADLTRLEDLDLSGNDLFSAENIQCLPRLTRLNIADNSLKKIQPAPGQRLLSLRDLILCQNQLSLMDFNWCPNLKMLDISMNCVGQITGLSDAQALEILIARDQRNTNDLINLVLSTPNECSEIYLSSNAIPGGEILLPETPQYNVRCLELASCGIQQLPPKFGDFFPNCRVMNLNFNAIQDLSPMIGAIKLKHLFLASNRIKRMRRTCLTMSRLPALTKIDIRNNPLTVGFYAPFENQNIAKNYSNRLPSRSIDQDRKWWQLLDDMTWNRRRAVELLLTECCPELVELDGLAFDSADILKENEAVNKLATIGVLKKNREESTTISDEVGTGHLESLIVKEERSLILE